jgi:hypothetical protein
MLTRVSPAVFLLVGLFVSSALFAPSLSAMGFRRSTCRWFRGARCPGDPASRSRFMAADLSTPPDTGLCLMLLLYAGMTLTSCGGSSSNSGAGGGTSGTQAGTYTITVSGSLVSGSTTLTHATKLTLVVQ